MTSISVKVKSGTNVQPMRRAASAGNAVVRSGVAENSAEAICVVSIEFSATIAFKSRSVAERIASLSSRSTVIAPRTPRTIVIGPSRSLRLRSLPAPG